MVRGRGRGRGKVRGRVRGRVQGQGSGAGLALSSCVPARCRLAALIAPAEPTGAPVCKALAAEAAGPSCGRKAY